VNTAKLPADDYKLGPILRPDNKPSFPLGWLLLTIVLIIVIVIILYFFFRQRTQLVEPSRVPVIRARYAVVPNIEKDALNTCGTDGQDPCIFSSTTLTRAIELCNINYKVCTEFSYDPISEIMTITNPTSTRRSSQQGNLYLQQVGAITDL
jgi:hypothetical protein